MYESVNIQSHNNNAAAVHDWKQLENEFGDLPAEECLLLSSDTVY